MINILHTWKNINVSLKLSNFTGLLAVTICLTWLVSYLFVLQLTVFIRNTVSYFLAEIVCHLLTYCSNVEKRLKYCLSWLKCLLTHRLPSDTMPNEMHFYIFNKNKMCVYCSRVFHVLFITYRRYLHRCHITVQSSSSFILSRVLNTNPMNMKLKIVFILPFLFWTLWPESH